MSCTNAQFSKKYSDELVLTFRCSCCCDEVLELLETEGYSEDFVCLPDSSSDNAIAATAAQHLQYFDCNQDDHY